MIKVCEKDSSINNKIDKVIYYLKIDDYDAAINNIKEVMVEDVSSGKIHNLLGIYYEKHGDFNRARKHYRVACDLEAALIATIKNLERLGNFRYICSDKYIDYGEERS